MGSRRRGPRADLESALTAARHDYAELNDRCAAAERQRDQAREQLAAVTAENDRLREQLADCQRKNAALAAAGTRKHDVVRHFADAFSKPDDRRMRHASVTESTIVRRCADAGVRP
jgi:septal ring factor EnvC (AmiA/AmiB activator)